LRRLGYSYTRADVDDFDQLLTTQQWDMVVVDNPSCYLGGCLEDYAYRSVSQYASAWGPSLLDTWTLEQYPELADAFGVVSAERLYNTLPALYAWQTTPLFDTPNAVPTTVSNWLIWSTATVGNRLTVTAAGATPEAGWAAVETADEAAIVTSNGGNSMVDGYLWVIANQDAEENGAYDGDGVQDVVELIMNQIVSLAQQPYVDITISPMATTTGATVSYTARTGPEVANVDWDAGDGNILSGWAPTHVYSEPGFYTVNATAYTGWGNGGRTSTRALIVGFPDAAPGHWACNQIIACFESGIVTGYWDGYHPAENVNRAQMAVYVARALAGGDANVPPGPGTPTFADVATDYWAFNYIEYAVTQAVVQGYWDGYHPEEVVNRAQMAVYMARAVVPFSERPSLPSYTPPGTATFPDVATDYWAYKYVEYCYAQGIVTGYWDGYHPVENVNRGQMAVYVQRAFDLWMPYS